MRKKPLLILVLFFLAYLALVRPFAPAAGEKTAKKTVSHAADAKVIASQGRDFTAAFNKQDAKTLAALWTEAGEHEDETGEILQGQAAIEKSFAELFKQKPNARMELLIESIRFPGNDIAFEVGLLRLTPSESELPTTTAYTVTHVREEGQWKIARSQETGGDRQRLEDLEWLLGDWRGSLKDQEVTLSFVKQVKKSCIVAEFVKKEKGKAIFSGSLKIAIDPARGQLRSWHFDDDGGHGQALWLRDGNRWLLDSIGVIADGTEMACINVLGRVNADAFTWRSIDRLLGNEKLPDTPPIKLTRVAK